MIVAKKDDLEIEVTVMGQKVNIEMPSMQDILFLWEGWIKQEEILAEKFLRSQYNEDPYPVLVNYLENNGWEITETNFSKS
jgi:hypothetical protein